MAILSKAGSPPVGLGLIRPLAWHSGPYSLGLVGLSCDGLTVPQHQISGLAGGWGKKQAALMSCKLQVHPIFSMCFPQALNS